MSTFSIDTREAKDAFLVRVASVLHHRISAFAGTDLATVLRANDIDTLVLYGIATGGVVLSTLTEAAGADYRFCDHQRLLRRPGLHT